MTYLKRLKSRAPSKSFAGAPALRASNQSGVGPGPQACGQSQLIVAERPLTLGVTSNRFAVRRSTPLNRTCSRAGMGLRSYPVARP